jgi:hypothetical protein
VDTRAALLALIASLLLVACGSPVPVTKRASDDTSAFDQVSSRGSDENVEGSPVLGPADSSDSLEPESAYPAEWELPLEVALREVDFPARIPNHPQASPDKVLVTCLSPDGDRLVMRFPLPAPPQEPLRDSYIEVFQSAWVGGDPGASYAEDLANDPVDGKGLYTVNGVSALGVEAHSADDETDENGAFLRFVLDGVEVQVFGGESLDLLIEIADSMG